METARILLIEDDRLVGGVIRDTLAAEGWEVTVRGDGGSGLAEIEGAPRLFRGATSVGEGEITRSYDSR